MKALVISDRSEIIDFVIPLIKEKGFDVIHYKWIIKALDNIEEIQPDIIILSACEYPRHWKTLYGFIQSGIGGNNIKIYLYDTRPLSEEDQKKADELGVLSFVENFTANEYDVEIALNEKYEKIKICSGIYSESEKIIKTKVLLTNGSYFNHISMFDGTNVTSFSGVVENTTDEFSIIRIK